MPKVYNSILKGHIMHNTTLLCRYKVVAGLLQPVACITMVLDAGGMSMSLTMTVGLDSFLQYPYVIVLFLH